MRANNSRTCSGAPVSTVWRPELNQDTHNDRLTRTKPIKQGTTSARNIVWLYRHHQRLAKIVFNLQVPPTTRTGCPPPGRSAFIGLTITAVWSSYGPAN